MNDASGGGGDVEGSWGGWQDWGHMGQLWCNVYMK